MRRAEATVELSLRVLAPLLATTLAVLTPGLSARAQDAGEDAATNSEIEQHFSDYLHYALVGRFEIADSHAQALLENPDLNPLTDEAADELIRLSDEREQSMDILLLIVNNSTIGDNAKKVIDLINEAHLRERKKPTRILDHIEMLAGEPNQQAFALEQLQASGEYAVPWMLKVLADPTRAQLHPSVLATLPKLGKKAINPLIAALDLEDEALLHFVMQTLGKIGYPQALPYLKRLAESSEHPPGLRDSAREAMDLIVLANPDVKDHSAARLFAQLAQSYFSETDSLMPDPREDNANVWYARQGAHAREEPLEPVAVPRDVYTLVKCMQTCRASIQLDPAQPGMLALWTAANFRREARLGMNVESEEAAVSEATRPENWPRSIYFARSFGPEICRLALSRAVTLGDRDIALGAIAALDVTAGPAAMVHHGDAFTGASLAEALHFPDLLVRIKAALALGKAMPQDNFHGSEHVVPTLAAALSITGKKFYLIVEPNEVARRKIKDALTAGGAGVASSGRLSAALDEAHKNFTHLDGIFLASDMAQSTIIEALREIQAHERFGKTPIVAIVKEGDTLILDLLRTEDNRVGSVFDTTGELGPDAAFVETLLDKLKGVAPKFGYQEISPEQAEMLALEAAALVGRLAESCAGVFDVYVAEDALVGALEQPSEKLQVTALDALAKFRSASAQQSIARVALASASSESLRLAAFSALAESARQFGINLDERQTNELMVQARGEPNLTLRTAASRTVGAMNLPPVRSAEILLTQQER